ncbi:MAG: hypothetical protein IPQ18_02290 [Saprospiraceae bacterium]|nr:hypothetical protein [Saprospiraceae bacterium]
MKDKLVVWGTNKDEKKVLLGIELKEADNKFAIYEFDAEACTEEFVSKITKDWVEGKDVDFPEHKTIIRELSNTEQILPEGYICQQPDVLKRANTEWHFIVLSNKLFRTYRSEIEMIHDKISIAEKYGNNLWDDLKGFWDKVQHQINEKNLLRDHISALKGETNQLFDNLKELRKKADEEFNVSSKEVFNQFNTTLDGIAEKIEKGMSLQPLFDQLRKVQGEIKVATLGRKDRNDIWDKLDATFKAIKEKRFGKDAGNGQGQNEELGRNEKRLEGLLEAIDKMEKSIHRDRQDLEYLVNKGQNADGQLEALLRQAKINMVQERVDSKQLKLDDMLKTKEQVLRKIEGLKAREEKRKEQAKVDEVKKEIEAKIADDIKVAAESRHDLDAKLEKAASEIKATKKPKVAATAPVVVPIASSVAEETTASPDAESTEKVAVSEEE